MAANEATSAQAGSPPDRSAPAFAEPWQAQIFAIVERLKDTGVVDPARWSQALGARLAALPPDSCSQDEIWACWVATLESLLMEQQIAAPLQLASLRQSWMVAAEKTPHGERIALGSLAYRWAGLDPETGA